VVCKGDSRRLINGTVAEPAARERNLALLRGCGYRHIQAAVNAATNGGRILVLPGVYLGSLQRGDGQLAPGL
jgi:hypothetical protein